MSSTINKHFSDAVEEVLDFKGLTLKSGVGTSVDVFSELIEAKQAIAETRAKLEEKDAAMCDLTEHFLQVYQIASDLALENDNSVLELRQLQLLSDNLKEQVSERDAKIAELEGRPFESDMQCDGLSDVSTEFANNRCLSSHGDDSNRSFTSLSRSRNSTVVSRRSPIRRSLDQSATPESLMTSLSLRLDGAASGRMSRIPAPPETLSRRCHSFDGREYLESRKKTAYALKTASAKK